jgi:phospholipid/cholesterol/gamma-HCH transport system permease protein
MLEMVGRLPEGSAVAVSGAGLGDWDSSLVTWLFKFERVCRTRQHRPTYSDLPEGAARLLKLAYAVPERKGARRGSIRLGVVEAIGKHTLDGYNAACRSLEFVGELTVAVLRLLTRRAKMPVADLWHTIAECGPRSLPIVTLIAGLVGLILTFLGAQQLRQFGATIYTANLVGVAMAREMGAVMAGVIMAGRVGAAFAAQLGSMQVNEEIDALKTFGFSPLEYLVLPRMLALVLMLPLLCLYADFVGVAGGAFVAWAVLDISPTQFYVQLQSGVKLVDIWLGVIKSGVFGILIALAGCMKGINCGRSASAVGEAVTSAVVMGIVAIVVADAVFALLTEIMGI